MSLLEIENLSLSIGDTPILNGVELTIDEGADAHPLSRACSLLVMAQYQPAASFRVFEEVRLAVVRLDRSGYQYIF